MLEIDLKCLVCRKQWSVDIDPDVPLLCRCGGNVIIEDYTILEDD